MQLIQVMKMTPNLIKMSHTFCAFHFRIMEDVIETLNTLKINQDRILNYLQLHDAQTNQNIDIHTNPAASVASTCSTIPNPVASLTKEPLIGNYSGD